LEEKIDFLKMMGPFYQKKNLPLTGKRLTKTTWSRESY